MDYVIHFLKSAGWLMCDPVFEMLKHVFHSLLNEKLVEDLNHSVSDEATRGTPAKTMDKFTRWQVGPNSGTFKGYNREEIVADNCVPLPRQTDHDNMFQYKYTAGTKEDFMVVTNSKSKT
jgi:hypothetical protein